MLSTMEQMYIDALELAIKMNYRVVIFTVDKYNSKYESKSTEIFGEELRKEINNTKAFGFIRKKYEIIDFGIVRNWDK